LGRSATTQKKKNVEPAAVTLYLARTSLHSKLATTQLKVYFLYNFIPIACLCLFSLLLSIDMYMSYGWGSTGENVTSERHTT